jgi:hypothetical protein
MVVVVGPLNLVPNRHSLARTVGQRFGSSPLAHPIDALLHSLGFDVDVVVGVDEGLASVSGVLELASHWLGDGRIFQRHFLIKTSRTQTETSGTLTRSSCKGLHAGIMYSNFNQLIMQNWFYMLFDNMSLRKN